MHFVLMPVFHAARILISRFRRDKPLFGIRQFRDQDSRYIAAVESSPELDSETLDWIAWAKAKADWYDPTVAAADPLFGKRNHSADPNSKTPTKKSSYFY